MRDVNDEMTAERLAALTRNKLGQGQVNNDEISTITVSKTSLINNDIDVLSYKRMRYKFSPIKSRSPNSIENKTFLYTLKELYSLHTI
jgi:hypothetical protein